MIIVLNILSTNDHFRFTLVQEEANKKFLEGMLLLADVKETNEKVRKCWENDGWPGHVN